MAPSTDGSLAIFDHDSFVQLAERLRAAPPTERDVRAFGRLFYAQARRVELDRQGRLLLPSNLRAAASLESKAVLSGIGNLFELWDEAQFNDRAADTAAALAEDAANGELPDVLMDISL